MRRVTNPSTRILIGDARDRLRDLPDGSAHCVVTSPPYWGLRSYGGDPGMIGLEATFPEHLENLVAVFREVRRVLRPDGTLWLNYGDAYTSGDRGYRAPDEKIQARAMSVRPPTPGGLKAKDLMLMPFHVAAALQADGWWVRSEIVWHKPNPMPESAKDRPTSSHEKVWLLSPSARYYYDADAVRVPDRGTDSQRNVLHQVEPSGGLMSPHSGIRTSAGRNGLGANLRNVWTIPTSPFTGWTETVDLVPLATSGVQELAAAGSGFGDDICRITSPDCPEHEGQPDWVPTGFCDGLPDHLLTRMNDTRESLVPEHAAADRANEQSPADSRSSPSSPSTQDCSVLGDSGSAIAHSTSSRRTVPAPASSEHAIPSEGTVDGTERTGLLPTRRASIGHDTDVNRSEADTRASSCEPGTVADTVRRSGSGSSGEPCCCRVYRKVVSRTSHFATFPPKLVEPCVQAGTSEHGCCAACGAPSRRLTEKHLDPVTALRRPALSNSTNPQT